MWYKGMYGKLNGHEMHKNLIKCFRKLNLLVSWWFLVFLWGLEALWPYYTKDQPCIKYGHRIIQRQRMQNIFKFTFTLKTVRHINLYTLRRAPDWHEAKWLRCRNGAPQDKTLNKIQCGSTAAGVCVCTWYEHSNKQSIESGSKTHFTRPHFVLRQMTLMTYWRRANQSA